MTSLTRMLAVLDLFTEATPSWTAEAINQACGYSSPTGYRYVRELTEAGLLRSAAGATYVLGPRIIELDYQVRVGDPLLQAGRDSMRQLAATTGCDVVMATIYGDRIITIHHEVGSETTGVSYGRGRRMPLFRGALSKLIVASLARARQRGLYEQHAEEGIGTSFAPSWDALLANAKTIRREGFTVSRGELDAGLVAIGVPLASVGARLVGSLGFVMSAKRYAMVDEARTAAMLREAGQQVEQRIERSVAAPIS